MDKLTLTDIASVLVQKNKLGTKESEDFVAAMFEVVRKGLEADLLAKVKGLGTFKIIEVEARESVNVNTGERVIIEGYSKITFTPDNTMKELVNKPFSQFETVILGDGVDIDALNDTPVEDTSADDTLVDDTIVEEASTAAPAVEASLTETPAVEASSTEALRVEAESAEKHAVKDVTVAVEEAVDEKTLVEKFSSSFKESSKDDEAPKTASEDEVMSVSLHHAIDVPANEESAYIQEKTMESQVGPCPSVEETIHSEVEDTEEDTVESSADDEPEAEESAEELEAEESAEEQEAGESAEEQEGEESDEELQTGSSGWKWILFSVISLVLIVFAGLGGYYYGVQETTARWAKYDSLHAQPEPPTPSQTAAVPKKEAVPVVQQSALPDSTATKKETSSVPSTPDYAAMDARVRTGAYVIIGMDREEKVRAGESLARLARRTLGEGMECYIEVYNGLSANTPLREGQTIKIPKLQLKKKRK